MLPETESREPVARQEIELDALRKMGRALQRYAGQRQVLVEVLRVLEELPWFTRTTVMLLSPDGKELVVDAVHDQHVARTDARYPRGEGLTGRVLQTGEAIAIARISEEPGFRGRVHDRCGGVREECGFICVPIVLGEEVVGTISADLPCQVQPHFQGVRRFMGVVSSLIAHDVKLRRYARQQAQILGDENLRLRGELRDRYRPDNIVGNSHAMQAVYQAIHQVAPAEAAVLIRGETGTGKELVASAIHYNSPRASGPFVKVNCAALSENLLESELFGHEKGAFTGALERRIGRIEQASRGTLLLDEIGDFSPTVQVKLLRVLQEHEFERVGSNETQKADVRIIAATNRDLEADVEVGRFRQDLYYRINVFPIYLPALRDRRDDILLLADHFVEKYARRMGKDVRRISTEAINMLVAYHWPGNVRELENCIERAVLVTNDEVIHGYGLPPTLQLPAESSVRGPGSLRTRVRILERDMIVDALKRAEGNMAAAGRELGITPRMIRYKIKNLGIDNIRGFRRQPRR